MIRRSFLLIVLAGAVTCANPDAPDKSDLASRWSLADIGQIPGWKDADLDFFLHGSMCDEFVPERVLWVFEEVYPDLFPGGDLSAYGVIGEGPRTLPIGFSRVKLDYMGGQGCWGINCASCHTAAVQASPDDEAKIVLGPAGTFDVTNWLGAIVVSTLRTKDPAAMKKYLRAYLRQIDPDNFAYGDSFFEREWTRQQDAIMAEMKGDPNGSKGVQGRGLQQVSAADLRLDSMMLYRGESLAPVVRATLRLFHNMRASANIPDEPPADPDPGPTPGLGRNEAFGILALSLLGERLPVHGPVKYGVVWNLPERSFVHWDGNNNYPIGRNLAALLGLGAPGPGYVHMEHVRLHTNLSQQIRAPKYPWLIDRAAAARGAKHYEAHCASCHEGPQDESKLYSPDVVGTDPNRVRSYEQRHADGFNKWLYAQNVPDFKAEKDWVRITGKYWAAAMDGVWGRSPYLHNGSVRTMKDLLTAPASRPRKWKRGARVYDPAALGFIDDGAFLFDTTISGNSNGGHDYGTTLTDAEKHDLIEYLKSR